MQTHNTHTHLRAQKVGQVRDHHDILHALVEQALKLGLAEVWDHRQRVCKIAPDLRVALDLRGWQCTSA